MSRVLIRLAVWAGGPILAFLAGFAVFSVAVMNYEPHAPAHGDAVVVLTGGELRVREGLKLFADGAGRRILISGVNRATSKDDLRRLSGLAPNLFECCVDVGYSALDTVGNATETRTWLETWGFRRLIVVTSNYHMPRSLMELGRALPGVELVPHAVISRNYQSDEWWRHPGAIKLVLREYVKFLPAAGRWMAGRLIPPAPKPTLPAPGGPELSSSRPRLTGL